MDVFVPDAEIAEIKLVPVAEALLYPDCPHNVVDRQTIGISLYVTMDQEY